MYVFDNAAPQAPSRLDALADVFDSGTIRHLDARGIQNGWQCLEVGGGRGSIACWLADRVAPRGRVLATDIDPRHLEERGPANLEVIRHDVLRDALPRSAFDLAHARLVLSHLADPDLAISHIVAALKPGGWLVVEDFEVVDEASAGGDDARERLSKTAAAMREVTRAASDARLGRSLARRLRASGLTNVDTEGRALLFQGRSAGARLLRLNFEQLREPILATGRLSIEEFEADVAALDDEHFELRSPILWTAWGQRPGA